MVDPHTRSGISEKGGGAERQRTNVKGHRKWPWVTLCGTRLYLCHGYGKTASSLMPVRSPADSLSKYFLEDVTMEHLRYSRRALLV